ncbi:MAG: quinolinate synthase [Alphaproteobacteria bacterium]|jgi:quinolinate synthase
MTVPSEQNLENNPNNGISIDAAIHIDFIPEFTEEVEKATAEFREKTKHVIPYAEYAFFAPYILEINRLKKEKNAIILAHNYMPPDIFYGVADIVGDSLSLAVEASKAEADIIVQCGVHFMAETSKILNPTKKILLPDLNAGCSLAASITGEDVRLLKQKYPGVPVVTYVNTSADVKAETDICCTSSNALQIVNSLESDTVIFIPDKYLAQNIAQQTSKKIITWAGSCMVHELFTPAEIERYKAENPNVIVLAHPECTPEVVAVSDFTGSTAGINNYVKEKKPASVMLITECSMADNIMAENPDIDFVKPCKFCPHMKQISLPKILKALQTETPEIILDANIIERAKGAVQRMIDFKG